MKSFEQNQDNSTSVRQIKGQSSKAYQGEQYWQHLKVLPSINEFHVKYLESERKEKFASLILELMEKHLA